MKNFIPLALCLALPAAALAQDQQVGARTKAMGGSYTAFEDDPISVWLNPAGIATQPDGLGVAYQSYTIYEFEAGGGGIVPSDPESGLNSPALIPSYLGMVFQLGSEGNQAIGLCFVAPFQMKMFWLSDQTVDVPLLESQVFYRLRASYARDFRIRPEGFLTHVSVGLAADISVTDWTHQEFKDIGGSNATITLSGSDVGLGGGAGLLVGLYDNTQNLKINLGAAWQSKASYEFSLPQEIIPVFDWPNQYQIGATVYLLDEFPLRVTVDAQIIQWSDASIESLVAGRDNFEDVVNVSAGVEYRIPVGDGVNLYPRAGIRFFDAPWEDKDDLPAVGFSMLNIKTDDDAFVIACFGLGVSWRTQGQKNRSLDLAVDVGGDAPGFAVSYNMEF